MKSNYKYIAFAVSIFIVGLFLGWLIFSPTTNKSDNINSSEIKKSTIWTCSMHPQIRLPELGKCPICGMTLVPLDNDKATKDIDINSVNMSEAEARLADIQTLIVKKDNPVKEIHLQGKVEADERNMSDIAARFAGRIEKLYVNFTGQIVNKGDLLAKIYSPELVTAQKELLEAFKYKETNEAMYNAAVNKLLLWDISKKQIDKIESSGVTEMYFDILAPISGTVSMMHVTLGEYVKKGETIFKLVDLSRLWIMFDVYESDLPWVNMNDKITYEISSMPGKFFTESISYIEPFINEKTRVAKLRLVIKNINNSIKPQMFAKGILKAGIKGGNKEIIIPKSSILWTGKRAVVYVKDASKTNPTFNFREIVLGSDAGSLQIVKKGLKEGEEIAVNGVFKIDAAAQLNGLKSMMNNSSKDSSSVDSNFVGQLTAFYKDYLKLKEAFIAADINNITKSIHLMHSSIAKINMNLLKGDSHIKWMNLKKKIDKSLNSILEDKNIDSKRFYFAELSKFMFETINAFKINEVSYYHFCPMANENKGAYWLSDSPKVRNPYLASDMLDCGEVKETIK